MKLIMENWRTYTEDPVEALKAAIKSVRQTQPEDSESGGFTTWSGHFYTYLSSYGKIRKKDPQKAANFLNDMINDAEGNYGMSHENMISKYIPDALPDWHKLVKNSKT